MRAGLDIGSAPSRWLPLIAHDIGDEHYHDDDDYALDHDPRNDGLWQADNVELISVGIDIGSSGTQVVFSRILLQRLGGQLSSRYYVVEREQLYQSPISLTPYAGGHKIDKAALAVIIADAYRNAGIAAENVDTGAVILTGEALRRENAQDIADILSLQGGQFVCTMAGHHIEARLAAYGSGAAWTSNVLKKRILNIDIGGGTTKYAIVEDGRVLETAAIHVGGRLHVFDETGALVRLEPAGQALAAEIGLDWRLGDHVTQADKVRLAQHMTDDIIAAVRDAVPGPDLQRHFLTDALTIRGGIDGVMFSGGVSEYVYGHEARDFQDMGKLLGHGLADLARQGGLPWPLLPAGAGIRATALGLSEYSVQLSGNTIYAPEPELTLPRRNLRVAQPDCGFPDIIDPDRIAGAITDYLRKFDVETGEEIAYAFRWQGAPTHGRILAFAQGLSRALAPAASRDKPLYILLDGDIARTLGHVLRDELQVTAPLLVVDGVVLSEFDYVDFGRVRLPSHTVPVTIKSLLFSKDPRPEVALRRE